MIVAGFLDMPVDGVLEFADVAIGATVQRDDRIFDGDELQAITIRNGDPDRNPGIFDDLLFHNDFPACAVAQTYNIASIVEFSACAASHSTEATAEIDCHHTERGFLPRAGGMMENNTHFADLLFGKGLSSETRFLPVRTGCIKVGAQVTRVNRPSVKNKIIFCDGFNMCALRQK
ncbi:MAG: hypothetical protein H5U11_15015 [Rhizobium sp.]|nr:hypothetical protein [Rhizobium sp.]